MDIWGCTEVSILHLAFHWCVLLVIGYLMLFFIRLGCEHFTGNSRESHQINSQ